MSGDGTGLSASAEGLPGVGSGQPELKLGRSIVIGPTPPPYHGVTVMTGHVVDAFRKAGLLAAHVNTSDDRPIKTLMRVDVENLRLGLVHSWQLVRVLRANPGAAVYFPLSQNRWGFLRDAVFVAIGRAFRRRIHAHFHGASFSRFREGEVWPVRILIRWVLASLDEVWVLTESLRSVFEGAIEPGRIRVVENAIDDPWPPHGPRRDRADRSLRLLFLGNLLPAKGADDFLDALILAASQRSVADEWSVRLVGEVMPDMEERIGSRVAELRKAGIDVVATGPLVGERKLEHLAEADVFVYPSRDDGQPLVILEAMAAGLAIVASDVGGIPDTVGGPDCGLIVPPSQAGPLAEAILRVTADSGLRESLGAAARARFEERYRTERLDRQIGGMAS